MKLSNYDDLGANDAERTAALWALAAKTKLHVQVKHNGISAIIKRPGDLAFITRNGKQWKHNFFPLHIIKGFQCLFDALPKDSSIYAELLSVDPSIPLATLSGWVNVNRERLLLDYANRIYFKIYDIANDYIAEPFDLRREQLDTARLISEGFLRESAIEGFYYAPIEVSETREIVKPEHIDTYYQSALSENNEGVVYRVDPCFFFDGPELSPHAFKRKKYYEVEGTIIGAVEGLGKRTGMLGSFIVRLKNGITVCAGGGRGIGDEILTRWWNDKAKMQGLPITIRYEELSKDNIPLRVQIVAVRTYE